MQRLETKDRDFNQSDHSFEGSQPLSKFVLIVLLAFWKKIPGLTARGDQLVCGKRSFKKSRITPPLPGHHQRTLSQQHSVHRVVGPR